jgi:hypothetical protein
MKLISLKMKKSPPEAVLQIPPSMTKTEVREYLTKIYEIPVLKISTMNYLGIHLFLLNLFVQSWFDFNSQVNGKDCMRNEKLFHTKEEILKLQRCNSRIPKLKSLIRC